MIKERRFNVHPEVLSCLLHLRLKTELGVRASHSTSDRNTSAKTMSSGRAASRRAKGKPVNEPHLTKKMKKVLKDKKEIAKEFRETEAEVDKEERAITASREVLCVSKLIFYSFVPAHGNPETPVCHVLSNTKKSSPYSVASSSIERHFQICTPR